MAASVFGPALPRAVRYAELLCGPGVERGLLGPREGARIWDRHLLNCAVVQEALPVGVEIIDVGSGAGLPGIPLVLARSDLRVTLLEPLLRRATFLAEVVAELGLADRVRVVRGRAEERDSALPSGPRVGVVARAVAPLPTLIGWCAPLLGTHGALVALRGERAEEELAAAAGAVSAARLSATIERCGTGVVDPPATVVVAVRG